LSVYNKCTSNVTSLVVAKINLSHLYERSPIETFTSAQVGNHSNQVLTYSGVAVIWALVVYLKCPPHDLRPAALGHWVDILGRSLMPMLHLQSKK